MRTNWEIAVSGIVPFCALLITFIVILCKRKIEDYYLRWCAIILLNTIILRILMSTIVFWMFYVGANEDPTRQEYAILQFKLQTVEFSIPYYFYLMVTVALCISALSFYTGLRDLLFPGLRA